MKKMTMICMAVLLAMAVSCKKNNEQVINNPGDGFRATVESHISDSKTHLDGEMVKWNANDAILIMSQTCPGGARFTTEDADTQEAIFKADESLAEDFYTPEFTAYYPAGVIADGEFTLPGTQTYAANSFGNGANAMVAVSETTVLPFKNICGVLELTLNSSTSFPVKKITLTSNLDGELLCGKGTVNLENPAEPVLTLTDGGNSVILNCEGQNVDLMNNHIFNIVVPAGTLAGGFTVKVEGEGMTWEKTAGAYEGNKINRSEIKPMAAEVTTRPEGSLPGKFSISPTQQVYFAKANLWYQASTNTWKFPDNQYDYIGSNNRNLGENYSGWIDLYGFATSGYSNLNAKRCYQPWSSSAIDGDYLGGDISGKADWGYNKISNGGDKENMGWFTLSGDTDGQWNYLISKRQNAASLFGLGRINLGSDYLGYSYVNGLILLPDAWTLPEDINVFKPGKKTSYTDNQYTLEQWAKMEAAGAVFLPATGRRVRNSDYEQDPGYRIAKTLNGVNSLGIYWSTTGCTEIDGQYMYGSAYDLEFSDKNILSPAYGNRYKGRPVRLVINAD